MEPQRKPLFQEVSKEQLQKSNKLQLNSGNVSEALYTFYHDLATRRGTPSSAGVAEALEYAKAYMAQKYELDRCHSCRQSVEADDNFCRKCGTKLR